MQGRRRPREEREARLPAPASCSAPGPLRRAYAGDDYVDPVREREIRTSLEHTTLSGNKVRRWRCRATRTTARS